MAASDLLLTLVKAGARGDQVLFRRTVEAIIAEERAKQHNVLADKLTAQLSHTPANSLVLPKNNLALNQEDLQGLVHEIIPRRSFGDLILPDEVQSNCRELIEEQQRADLLRSYGLEPRHKVLLAGPPGNGKTSLAEALAEALIVPLLVVRYENIIGSYLGETALRLRKLFDNVRTRHCVLFFDEFDTIGKERSDEHEMGEIKRVVSSLLLQIDALPSYVVVVSATNHPNLLDKAVWRRFQLRLYLPNPNEKQIALWLSQLEDLLGEKVVSNKSDVVERLKGFSFAELEEFGADIMRRRVLDRPKDNVKRIFTQKLNYLQSRYDKGFAEKNNLYE